MLDELYYNLVKKYRHDLHLIPEVGFDLYKTNNYLKEELTLMGYEIEDIALTGIIAIKRGNKEEAIAFRTDMDGLPVEEKTNLEYKSIHDNKMHACGHDGHMAILLCFAKYLSNFKAINKTIILIFQPAEEGPGGAKVIIEAGLFKRYNIKYIFGLHLYPNLDEGKIGIVEGPMMAQNGEIDINIQGLSCHGATPHLGSDAILAASCLINNYQTIISRHIDPLNPAVLTIGTISGGEARNIIAGKVNLSGTIRCFNIHEYQEIKDRIDKINQGLEVMYKVKVKCVIIDYYPPVINDSNLYQMVKDSLNQLDYQVLKPMMLAEDFAFYQQIVPGFFVMLGCRNELKGYTHPLHSGYFNFEESVLISGVKYYIHICNILKVFNS
jgi:hippurate hydrolase